MKRKPGEITKHMRVKKSVILLIVVGMLLSMSPYAMAADADCVKKDGNWAVTMGAYEKPKIEEFSLNGIWNWLTAEFNIFVEDWSVVFNGMEDSYFNGNSDKNSLEYDIGETMNFDIHFYDSNGEASCRYFKWKVESDDGAEQSGIVSGRSGKIYFSGSVNTSGFVHVSVTALNMWWVQVGEYACFSGGAGADTENVFHAVATPSDFVSYWESKVALVDRTPATVLEMKTVENPQSGFIAYDMKVSAPNDDAASFYLTMPENAANKSLSIAAYFLGAGVYSASLVYNSDCISIGVNSHSIENGREKEYYSELNENELDEYWSFGSDNADTSYFLGMLLRDLQAMRYAESLPQWDGINVTTNGGSQGGYQSIAMAALDKNVTVAYPVVPWMCDLGGPKVLSRVSGFAPEYTDALRYFDTVNFAMMVNCKIEIYAGLGDYTCPPSGIMSMYNALSCEKTMTFVQGRTHGYAPPDATNYIISSS